MRRAAQRADAGSGPACLVADIVFRLQGQGCGHPDGRRATARQSCRRGQRPQVRRADPHHGPVDRNGHRRASLVGDLGSQPGRHLCHPGRDCPQHRGRPGVDLEPRGRTGRDHAQCACIRPLSQGPEFLPSLRPQERKVRHRDVRARDDEAARAFERAIQLPSIQACSKPGINTGGPPSIRAALDAPWNCSSVPRRSTPTTTRARSLRPRSIAASGRKTRRWRQSAAAALDGTQSRSVRELKSSWPFWTGIVRPGAWCVRTTPSWPSSK